ncbi:hypothetical protein AAC387_Pa02g3784 [Persea americana]
MAAGQQKKRLNSPSFTTCNFQEQYRVKKKKHLEPSQNVLNMRGHIFLEWDDIQKKAVAKKEQIGITWRDITPFIGSVPQSHMDLADVFPIPQEIFELENLTEVLSYEVWRRHLSENERKVLVQFLPKDREIDVDQTVQSLLMGDNLHFGNPFLIWGAALCSGYLHPDAVLHRERWFRTNKRTYYAELQTYHKDILENLQELKDKWRGCKDPEKDITEKMWSSVPKNGGKSFISHENESTEHFLEENLAATADSSSWVVDEKAGIGDKEITQGKKAGEPQERKGPLKRKGANLLVASGKVNAVTNIRKEELPQKLQTLPASSAKYMSYIKISRKQHQLVKTIKQSGDGIQSKSLNRVLGDIKSFHVQPYETFEEEERNKLHEYWLQLVSRDLPKAFTKRGEIKHQHQELKKSLEYEISQRMRSIVGKDEEENNLESPTQKQGEDTETKEDPRVDVENCKDDYPIQQSTTCHPLQQIPSLNTRHELEPMVLYSEDCNQDILKQETTASSVSDLLEKNEDVEQDTSAKDIWQTVTSPDSYFPPPPSHGFNTADLSLGQPQPVEGRPSRMIDLETDILEQDDGQSLLHGPTDEAALHIDNQAHMFPYVNRDRSELLSAFLREHNMLASYPSDPMKIMKQHGLEFFTANGCPTENGQFPQQFQEQQQQRLIEQGRAREKELYMQQVMQKNMYSNGRYPSQELFPSIGIQDWPAEPVCTTAFQAPIKTGLLGHNWFSGDQRARNSWSGVEVSGTADQCLGQGSRNTDESLFSVLSQCNSLQSQRPYNLMNSASHIPERNFVSGSVSSSGDGLAYSHQFNYLSAHEATATTAPMKENNGSWMNLPLNPNSSLHDSVGKPFLRPWTQ